MWDMDVRRVYWATLAYQLFTRLVLQPSSSATHSVPKHVRISLRIHRIGGVI